MRHDEHAAGAIAEIQERSAQRTPGSLWHPHEFRRTAILLVGDPNHGRFHGRVSGVGHTRVAEHVAVEAPHLHPIDPVFRSPKTFLIGHEKTAVRIETHSVGGPETGCQDIRLETIGPHPEQCSVVRHHRIQGVATGLGIIQVARLIGLQTHGEFVEVLGDLVVVVEIADEIDLPVAVQILDSSDLIAAGDEEILTAIFDSQWLEQTAHNSFPPQGGRCRIRQAFHTPNIPVPSAHHGGAAIGSEIEATRAHPTVPRVLHRQRKVVGNERALGFPRLRPGLDFFVPPLRATVSEGLQIHRSAQGRYQRGQRRWVGHRNTNPGLGSRWQFGDPKAGLFCEGPITRQRDRDRLRGYPQLDGFARFPQIQGAGENRRGAVIEPARRLEHPRATDSGSNDHRFPMQVEPVVPSPFPRQGAVATAVLAEQSAVGPVTVGRCHSRSDRIDEMPLADESSVGAVAAIEGDALPIHEFTGRRRGYPQRVLIVDHPSPSFANATGPLVQTNGDAFLGDVSGFDLEGPKERWAEIHPKIRRGRSIFLLDRSPCEPLG